MKTARIIWAGLLGSAVLLAACSHRGLRSDQAVRQAIEAHVKSRSDLMMSNMTMEVQGVKFDGDTAQADVKYRSKDNADLAVSVHYSLKLAGDHWEVVSSSSANGSSTNPHAGAATSTPQGPAAAPTPAPSH